MLGALVRRGLLAGLLAGALAGLIGLVLGGPAVDAAVELEAAAVAGDGGQTFSRAVQRFGLVLGTALAGIAVGVVFSVAAAWSVGRVDGNDWQRALKLGAALVAAVVVLPALAYPPLPPGAGDPASVSRRAALYLGTAAVGVLLVGAARGLSRVLGRTRLASPVRQVLVGLAAVAAAGALLAVLPAGDTADGLPAELLWSFRLSSITMQALLWGGTAVVFGLLSQRRTPMQPTHG